MHELDLIPDDYRQAQRLRTLVNVFIVLLLLLVCSIAAGKFMLSKQLRQIESAISQYENDKRSVAIQHQTLVQLREQRDQLHNKVKILENLRGGPPARHMFVVMDRVLDKGTWFNKWSFMRAGEFQEVPPETVETGYFVIIKDDKRQQQERAWKLNTHMELNGLAIDHTYLATFVNRLITQPEIEDVKVLKTASRKHETHDVIDFGLAVTVNNKFNFQP